MWFDVAAARAGRSQPSLAPANPARAANPSARLAGLAEIAGEGARIGHVVWPTAIGSDLADLLDAAEERAAIIEHDGGLSRAEAERLALAAVECPKAVQVLRERWGMAP